MNVEEEAKKLFQQWQKQNASINNIPGMNGVDPNFGTDQSPHLFEQGKNIQGTDQSPVNPINSVRPMGPPPKTPPPQNFENVPGSCSECGMLHPPMPAGQKCPNAPIKGSKDNPNAVDNTIVNKHLVDIRNIIMTQITSKKIQDEKKFFQYAVIELSKSLEKYSE